MARRGRLVPIPPGMRLVHPTRPWPFLRSPLLSLPGRIRALAHPQVRASRSGDESVGAFVQRRYGAELLTVLGEPLLAGIHLADPWRLSLRDELSVTMGGSFARSVQPAVSRVNRWPAGTPLYRVGHADWLVKVRAACAASPGLWLAGAPYDGVGILDCIRQARETAAAAYLTGGRA